MVENPHNWVLQSSQSFYTFQHLCVNMNNVFKNNSLKLLHGHIWMKCPRMSVDVQFCISIHTDKMLCLWRRANSWPGEARKGERSTSFHFIDRGVHWKVVRNGRTGLVSSSEPAHFTVWSGDLVHDDKILFPISLRSSSLPFLPHKLWVVASGNLIASGCSIHAGVDKVWLGHHIRPTQALRDQKSWIISHYQKPLWSVQWKNQTE